MRCALWCNNRRVSLILLLVVPLSHTYSTFTSSVESDLLYFLFGYTLPWFKNGRTNPHFCVARLYLNEDIKKVDIMINSKINDGFILQTHLNISRYCVAFHPYCHEM